MEDTLYWIDRNGVENINWDAYRAHIQSFTSAALHSTIRDCKAAIEAFPEGHKAGYYQDEIHECYRELTIRRDASKA